MTKIISTMEHISSLEQGKLIRRTTAALVSDVLSELEKETDEFVVENMYSIDDPSDIKKLQEIQEQENVL